MMHLLPTQGEKGTSPRRLPGKAGKQRAGGTDPQNHSAQDLVAGDQGLLLDVTSECWQRDLGWALKPSWLDSERAV